MGLGDKVNRDLQVLRFIESNTPIKRQDAKLLLLWLVHDEDLSGLIHNFDPEEFDSILNRLISEGYVVEKLGLLYINEEKLKAIRNYTSKIMSDSPRYYSLELQWSGRFILNSNLINLEEREKIIFEELKKNQCISLILPETSSLVGKLVFRMRYFKTEVSLAIRRNSFLISSRAAIPDIPQMEGTEYINYPLTDIPKERDLFSIVAAPNIAANLFVLNILEIAITKLDPTAQLLISVPNFELARGEDPFEK